MKLFNSIVGIILAACLSLYTTGSKAEEVWVHLGAVSKHFQSRPGGYNEEHKLFAVEYGDWQVGGFENSNNDESYFALKNYRVWELQDYLPIKQAKYVDLGFSCGIVTGYEQLSLVDIGSTNITAGCLPKVFIEYGNLGFDINFAGVVVEIGFKFKF